MALKLKKKNTQVKKIIKKKTPVMAANNSRVSAEIATNLTLPTGEYIEATGRRKVATARVRLYTTKGDFVVNNKIAGVYFDTIPHASTLYNEPFMITGTQGTYSVTAKVSGSGVHSQLGAMRLAIAKALVKIDPEFKTLLKAKGLLTRDDRMKETRKIGMGGKARRSRQSPKR